MRYCTVKDCGRKHASKGLCKKHYMRVLTNGTLKTKIERHGRRGTPEYNTWQAMKRRCFYTKDNHYKIYGERGIKVCDRWKNSFIAFYEDMGNKPSLEYSLERKDNNGNYEPSNCKWATKHEQASNKRNSNTVVGVCKDNNGGWESSLTINKVRVFRKWFSSYEEAVKARKNAEQKHLLF